MARNILKTVNVKLFHNSVKRTIINEPLSRCYSLWEPDYLDLGKSEIPYYPIINVRLRSYDFSVLEKYQKYIHTLAENMDIDVDNSYAFPAKNFKVKLYKENTAATEAEYKLNIYERNTQLSNVSSIEAPLLIRILEASLPEGVNLHIAEYDPSIEAKRYIPDKQLLDLQKELEDLKAKREA